MKKVLINALLLKGSYSGVQYSIEYFIKTLSETETEKYEFTVLLSNNYSGSIKETKNLKIHKVSFNSSKRLARVFYENYTLDRFFFSKGFDLYHATGYVLPFFSRMPSIVCIHDIIALKFPSLCKNETAIYYNLFMPSTIRRAHKIIAVSNSVKEDILETFPKINADKIKIAYHGVHPRFKKITDNRVIETVKKKYALPDKYLLFIGNIEPKKNLNLILNAFITLKKDHKIKHKLVLVGQKGWKFSTVFQNICLLKSKNELYYLNYVDEEDLPILYSCAEIFLFPSLYEGFGLPVLEAMACKCPVIISDRGSLPEISGGFCPQINPSCADELVEKVLKILHQKNYKTNIVNSGTKWSNRFTWARSVEAILDVYDEII